MNSTLEIDTSRFEALLHEKSGPCVSIVIPTHKTTKARMKNPDLVKKAVDEAKDALQNYPVPDNIKEITASRLDLASATIDHLHALEGLGIFVSPAETAVVKFPFPVKEKVVVGNSFEIYDLLYLKQLSSPCFVLLVNKKSVRLFELTVDSLREKDSNFPHLYEEQYEYSPPSRGSSYGNSLKGFEKDKGTLNMLRIKSFLKESDTYLAAFFYESDRKLILAGTKKISDTFESISYLKKNIIGKVYGSFGDRNIQSLQSLAWLTFISYKKNEVRKHVLKLRDPDSDQRLFTGITEVWKAAAEGKGLMLLVERDYKCPAYLQETNAQLHLSPPVGEYKITTDAVEDVIETVYKKNGTVLFTDKKQLDDVGHIVLISRY